MAPPRRTTSATLAAMTLTPVLAVVLAGCGGGDQPSSTPRSGSPTTAPTSEAAPTAPSPSPSVEVASGPLVTTRYVQARLPAGWHVAPKDVTFQRAGNDDHGQEIDVGYFPTLGSHSYKNLADAMNLDNFDNRGTILPPVTINGVKYAHVRGRQYQLQVDDYETYLVTDISHIAGVTFSLNRQSAADKRQAIIDQVLPTVKLTP